MNVFDSLREDNREEFEDCLRQCYSLNSHRFFHRLNALGYLLSAYYQKLEGKFEYFHYSEIKEFYLNFLKKNYLNKYIYIVGTFYNLYFIIRIDFDIGFKISKLKVNKF